jgi:predicted AAA+ superfamily ATPase
VVHKAIETYKIKFALTGSSARKLKKGSANLLAGRAASFHFFPFSALELGEDFNLLRSLKFGNLPYYWNQPLISDQDCARSLYSYVATYLKEEIASEQLVRNLEPFRRFLICAAQMNGKIINYSKIERDAGIAPSQSSRHFEILVDTLVGEYLEPYHQSIRKRQTQKSKFYFFDTGVVRALQNLVEEDLNPGTFEYGDLFETFLMNEFFKLRSFLEKRWNYSYLRTKDDVEIDLIIEKPKGKIILVEIKSTDKLTADQFSNFCKIAKDFPESEKYVLSTTQRSFEVDGIKCLHWQEGLKKIFDL